MSMAARQYARRLGSYALLLLTWLWTDRSLANATERGSVWGEANVHLPLNMVRRAVYPMPGHVEYAGLGIAPGVALESDQLWPHLGSGEQGTIG
jgi:hypothetical protein